MTACKGCGAALRLPYDPPGPGVAHKSSLHCVLCWADPEVRGAHETKLQGVYDRRRGRRRPLPRTGKQTPLETVLQEWVNWRGEYTPDEVARMLRMSYGTFYRAIHRARAAGDPRANGFPGRHGLSDPARRLRTSTPRRSW
jgi:hypothetical protein